MDNADEGDYYTEAEYLEEESSHDNGVNNNLNSSINDNTSKSKKRAEWDRPSTVTLILLYHFNLHLADNPTKKSKLWPVLSREMIKEGFDVTADQVRWKFNSLYTEYKECVDHNNQSGTNVKTFEFFNEMEDIFGYSTKANPSFTLSSSLPSEPSSSSMTSSRAGVSSLFSGPSTANNPSKSATTSSGMNDNRLSVMNKISSNNLKRNKNKNDRLVETVPIKQQKLKKTTPINQVLQLLNHEQERRVERDEELLNYKEETKHLKERQLTIREREIEIKNAIELKRLVLKEKNHKEAIKLEKEKCNLLKKLISNKEDKPKNDSSESDSD